MNRKRADTRKFESTGLTPVGAIKFVGASTRVDSLRVETPPPNFLDSK